MRRAVMLLLAAACTQALVDECADSAKSQLCSSAGQVCQDPDTAVPNNFVCKCQLPATATKAGGPVDACLYDECAEHGTTCAAAGQRCTDSDRLKLKDWVCECLPPQAGTAGNQQSAECRSPPGDCDTHGRLCSAAGQLCVDATPRDDKITCECLPPSTGRAGHQAPAVCLLDECVVTCPHCARTATDPQNVCEKAGQRCEDGDHDPLRTRDWRCLCSLPATGSKLIAATECELDECVARCPTCADSGSGNVCEQAGQTCVERSLTQSGDWECQCITPAYGSALGRPSACDGDECRTGGWQDMLCVSAGQTCVDPDKSKSGDWTCTCPPPSTTVGQQAPAVVCEMDECNAGGAPLKTCEAAKQICVDYDKSMRHNWQCLCKAPGTGVQLLGPVAQCELDECAMQCPTCANANGQGNVCELSGQTCEDLRTTASSLGDWTCKCPVPSSTTALTAPVASCEAKKDECVQGPSTAIKECVHAPRYTDEGCLCKCNWESQFTCSGDACKGLDPKAPGTIGNPCKAGCCNPDGEASDWCYIDKNDNYNQGKPTCMGLSFGFCTAAGLKPQDGGKPLVQIPGVPAGQNNVCTDVGQQCVDPDTTTDGDWVCECVLPLTGPLGQQQATTCVDDECTVHAAACGDQICKDDDKTKKDSWTCECKPPSPPNPKQGGPTTCALDECVAVCPTCAMENGQNACEAAGQTCEDPGKTAASLSDWRCVCKGGAAGCDVINECGTVCPTCANTGSGNMCAAAGQKCVDPSHAATGDWYCECVVGHGISVGSAVPRCVLDECADVCLTCAKRRVGDKNVCEQNGQTCVDPDPDTLAVDDWRCVCPPPLQHIVQEAGVAVCEVDECADQVNGTVPGFVCTKVEQLCSDPKPGTLGDFVCRCPSPSSGMHMGSPVALCTVDECTVHGPTCTRASQTCLDPDATKLNDWVCLCPPPSSTVQIGGVATCELDECQTMAHLCPPEQDCQDGNRTVKLGHIGCVCRSPLQASNTNGSASCLLDECVADCATCPKRRCADAGQTCEDADPGPTSLGDWYCRCAPPSTASAVGNVAECPVDECLEKAGVCLQAGQTCVDPNHAATRTGDWECVCPPPTTGVALGQAATCTRDECLEHGHVCTDKGQTCSDPAKLPDSLSDWKCHCIPPAMQVQTGAPAVCQLVGECSDATINEICTSVGQTCVDPSKTTANDWTCECVAPSTGRPRLGGPAACTLDECQADCGTCAKGACTRANQECVDTNLDPVTGLSTWECRCVAPQSGSKALARAECTVDECALYGSTCTTANQDCQDPDAATRGDWLCVCRAPSVGRTTRAAAACVADECAAHGKTCTDAGQTCFDVNKAATSLGDWECRCAEPGVGSAVGKPVVPCTVDECRLYGDVCTNAGQTCRDDEKEIDGFWFCVCQDGKMRGDQKAAACVFDECVETGATTAVAVAGQDNVCVQKGQTCVDTNTLPSALKDWRCVCPAPHTETFAVAAAVAQCGGDECTGRAGACAAGQVCVDPDWRTTNDWECRCTPPAKGTGRGTSAAECLVDECFENGKVCRDAGQVCVDADKTTANTWTCACPSRAGVTNSKQMAPASCPPPAESECTNPANAKICKDKGQLCVDPNTSTKNDWTCECVAPAAGAAVAGAPATCVLDECVADCNTCAHVTCAAAGQVCVDPNTDATSVKDWECRCAQPRSGKNVAAPAVCQLDECKTVCTSCADHGAGNACLLHGQTCVDPNTDARSPGDWMCVCKPANLGTATMGLARCVVDECEKNGPLVCKGDQTCNDPNTAPDSLGDWTCTCLPPAAGSGTAMRAHCTLNECNNQDNYVTCSQAGQFCVDPNPLPDSLKDWECRCPQGAIAAVMKPAECTLNECTETCKTCANKGGGNVCAAAGQTCLDPNTGAESTADWTCTCSTGAPSAVANVAVCPLDECTMPGNYAAHTCEDTPRVTAEGCTCLCNWRSTSGLPATASGPGLDTPCKAGCCNPDRRAGGDWCYVEDTVANKAKGCRAQTPLVCARVAAPSAGPVVNACTRGGQVCVDRDTRAGSQGDWQCECAAPATGAPQKLGLAAKCELDECTANFGVCEAAGQVCRDGTGVDDWECVCAAPATGSKARGAATCARVGECDDAAVALVCGRVGQTCVDPDVTVKGDWLCACVGPTKGVSVKGAPAVCILDECTARCATCADGGFGNVCAQAGQTCAEGSKSADDVKDWRCVCPEGQLGEALTAVAVCRVDECLLNRGQHTDLCGAAGQTCVDPNTKAGGGLGDWMCVCPPPGQGKATGKLALCRVDECQVTDNRNVCTQAGQQCVDSNQHGGSLGDWECVCVSDERLRAVGKAADCHVPPAWWCGLNGKTCTEVGQTCKIGRRPTDGSCACIAPQTGSPQTGAAADCSLDECVALCPTCADSGGGNVCEAHGQTCVEGSKSPESLKDWRCTCANTGAAAVAAVATCSVNECDQAAARQVCLGAEQACVDPNTSADATGDWYCECHAPLVGGPRKVGGVATCTYDECLVHAATCQAHGQTCTDPNVAAGSRGDWTCVCPPPATGTAAGAAAACKFAGECDDAAKSKVCEQAGQTCVDPDASKAGDWECRCVAPQTGAAGKQAAAACVLDECKMACPTCALKPGSRTHACSAAGQACVDLDTQAYSTGDWKCVCVAPQSGEQLGAAAACDVDECADASNKRVCEAVTGAHGDAVQLCRDPDTRLLGDWGCLCIAPYVGTPAVREAAVCTLDECSMGSKRLATGKNGDSVCGAAGQVCVDPQQEVDARDNWLCKCAGGGGSAAVTKAVPRGVCEPLTGPCVQRGGACPSGQRCTESGGEWYCECVQPAVGRKQGGAATCTLDECTARCPTCAQQGSVHACAVAEQSCADANTGAESLKDWSCACETGVGRAKGQAATCVVDECVAHGGVCTAARQSCTDPDKTSGSTGDWMCHCERPAAGSATAGAAQCSHDECVEHAKTCAAAGQACVDENEAETSVGDWVCTCPPPATGSLVGGVATCAYKGGCADAANRKVCSAAGQKCVSVDSEWSCACMAPSLGAMGSKGPATCTLDECLSICPTCARGHAAAAQVCRSAGQACKDPNTSAHSLSDWVCECPAPLAGVALGRPAETCGQDECVVVSQHGARKCGHFQRFTVQGCACACPWRVESSVPGFDGPGFSEDCVQGCCNPNKDPKGDWCMIADTPFNRGRGCLTATKATCADASVPPPAGAPALVLPAGATVPNVCTEQGQICVDAKAGVGDWECRCPFSDGTQTGAAVASCEMDECRVAANAKVCTDAGQTCVDPNTKAGDNWECRCSGSATGANTMAPVAAGLCMYSGGDECKAAAHRETCTDAGQFCFDPDTDTTGDWECRCTAPATGTPGRQAVATCTLDECVVQCATCADKANGQGHACSKEGQLCTDPSTLPSATGDWVCKCQLPAIGKEVAAAATCVFDECRTTANNAVCVSAGQRCVDPTKTMAGTNDWECQCAGKGVGTGVTKPATCVVNECLEPAKMKVCANAGQTCFDPNTNEASVHDYKCRCPAPASGEAVASAATCTFTGECSDMAKSRVCTDAGQTCLDPDVSVEGDWICACVAPKSGVHGKQAAATCGTDECTAHCATCETGVCKAAEQLCVDPDVTVEGNWLCRCVAPKKGDDVTMAVALCQACAEMQDEPACQAKATCMWDNVGCTDMTPAPPTQAPPTQAPPTQAPPTQAPPTQAPPTQAPPTQAPPTQVPPTQVPPTQVPPTQVPPTETPQTQVPPTDAPAPQCSLRNETDCEASPHCAWDSAEAECTTPCADHTDSASCVLAQCLWDTRRPLWKCMPAGVPPVPGSCKDYQTDQARCNDDARCEWDDAADTCGTLDGAATPTPTQVDNATALPRLDTAVPGNTSADETPLPASTSPGTPQPTDAPENGRVGCKRLRRVDDGSGVAAEVAVTSCALSCGTVYFAEGARTPYCDPCNGVPPGLFVTITRGDGLLHTVTYEKDGLSVPMKQDCGVCFTPRLGAGSVDVMIPCPPAPKSSPVLIIVAAVGGGVLLVVLCFAVYWFKFASRARRPAPVFSTEECQATLLPHDHVEQAFELEDLDVCAGDVPAS